MEAANARVLPLALALEAVADEAVAAEAVADDDVADEALAGEALGGGSTRCALVISSPVSVSSMPVAQAPRALAMTMDASAAETAGCWLDTGCRLPPAAASA